MITRLSLNREGGVGVNGGCVCVCGGGGGLNRKTCTEPFDQHSASPTQIRDNVRIHQHPRTERLILERFIYILYTKYHPTVTVSQKESMSSQITKYASLMHCVCTTSPYNWRMFARDGVKWIGKTNIRTTESTWQWVKHEKRHPSTSGVGERL